MVHDPPKTAKGSNYMVCKRKHSVAIALLTFIAAMSGLVVPVAPVSQPQWSKTYGGPNPDQAYSMIRAVDQGYALAGGTNSSGAGKYDFWLLKTDSSGNALWNKTYGGATTEFAYSATQTSDEGYALAGYADSNGTGVYDFWLVKTDSLGSLQWSRTYGGSKSDVAYSVITTVDGGYALTGYTYSYGAGLYNFWLVKTDSSGNEQWNRTYTGGSYNVAYSVVQTSDRGFALAGFTYAYGAGLYDIWLVKTDPSGNALWNKTYGGPNSDVGYSLVQTSDSGYALAGYTNSYGAGLYDFWLVKTDSHGDSQWSRTYGGAGHDQAFSLIQTNDEGYGLAGYTKSNGALDADFWLVKTDSTGNTQWNKTYGGAGTDVAHSAVLTSDEGYTIGGYTNSYGAGSYDFWLVKVPPEVYRDVAITTLTPSKTVVGQGYSMSVDVTVQNQGSITETFAITVYYDSNTIGTQIVNNLAPENSIKLEFRWDTTGIACGNYIISAVSETVLGETDTADNTLTGGAVKIVVPGDVNADGIVSIVDFGGISAHWYPGPPIGPLGYASNFDINDDKRVDIVDVGIVSANWERTAP